MIETAAAVVAKVANRPSTIWRLAWLIFCLIAPCLFGTTVFRQIVPYVLAGVEQRPRRPEAVLSDGLDDGPLTTWVPPCVVWTIAIGFVAYLLLR